jgi:segregation and condensation protein B
MSSDQYLRMIEALLFASDQPLSENQLAERVPEGVDVAELIDRLQAHYAGRGVNLVEVAGKWMFRTAPDLAFLLRREVQEARRLSRAAVETMAIIAYHQPITRAEIENIRGVGLSKGTLDVLMEENFVRMLGRRRSPGRPVTYGTTQAFLVHFGLPSLKDLPGIEELKAAGLLENVNVAMLKFSDSREEAEGGPAFEAESQFELPTLDIEADLDPVGDEED